MNISNIKTVTNKITPIDEEAWQSFEQYFSIRKLKKNEILWNIGDLVGHVVFINSGLIRGYYILDGKEMSVYFFFENRFVTNYNSFISRSPSELVFDALEETEIITIPRPAIYELYDRYKCFERFGRIIAEQNFLGIQSIQLSLKGKPPEEKYLDLIKERPKVMQRVPLNMIASYLNITPEHLSRIRKKITSQTST